MFFDYLNKIFRTCCLDDDDEAEAEVAKKANAEEVEDEVERAKAKAEKVSAKIDEAKKACFKDDIVILYDKMDQQTKEDAVFFTSQALAKYTDWAEIVAYIKAMLNRTHGPGWNCISLPFPTITNTVNGSLCARGYIILLEVKNRRMFLIFQNY
jgi:Dynein light chain type 1